METTVFDSLTAAVDFTDLIAALGIIYAGMITVGLFMKGANLIARKLGWT